ncbi:MAG: 2Fe-2S iron-sulfur cluster-binding protein [Acetobacteraceae bacterium]|nr:(2Fe-2S)-binding protein [Acetobacteraceae bacterium]MDI3308438.1 2Fe-2S iron-sulfur cluster-binding protein [Acetobacteraceae bacterium]
MPRIIFEQPDGSRLTLDSDGMPTVMHVAVRHDVPGLPAECGGQCACATCMVDVDPEWLPRLPPAGPDEADMLADALGTVPPGRRLSCQIGMEAALDGLVVRVPPRQG